MHLHVMKEENSPIKTYATIYMHYQFEMKKKILLQLLPIIKPTQWNLK